LHLWSKRACLLLRRAPCFSAVCATLTAGRPPGTPFAATLGSRVVTILVYREIDPRAPRRITLPAVFTMWKISSW